MKQLLFVLCLIPSIAQAWWNDEWPNRVTINVNQNNPISSERSLENPGVLLRLHTGNFSDFFYFNQDVSDLRFIASDDVTPLKHHIEKFDLINQLMFVWVKFPDMSSSDQNKFIHMYYGNANAKMEEDEAGTFDVNQVAVFHFNGSSNIVVDSTAYSQKSELINVERNNASLIGAGLKFNKKSIIKIIQSPVMDYLPGKGFSFSSWIKPQGMQNNSTIFNHQTNQGRLTMAIDKTGLYAQWEGLDGVVKRTSNTAPLTLDTWQHIAINLDSQRLAIFIDGIEMASVNVSVPSFEAGIISIGGDADGNSYIGELDEVVISSINRKPQWYSFINQTQSQVANYLSLNKAEQMGSDESISYFTSSLKSVSIDGWVVIVVLMVMAAISWMVMVGKVLMLRRMYKDNRAFMIDFNKLSTDETATLDTANDENQDTGSEFLNVVFGKHDHYQSSPNYHLYHQGIHELKQRISKTTGSSSSHLLTPQSINAIRATLDASIVRESQNLSSNMVLLTIAIAGGPFLGLLGTVLGVMITFSAIAISGNVDINAIAPGVSAALMTTVAGLFVAIPALFAYNYLSVRIKDLMFDMDVFVNELITKIAEQHS